MGKNSPENELPDQGHNLKKKFQFILAGFFNPAFIDFKIHRLPSVLRVVIKLK